MDRGFVVLAMPWLSMSMVCGGLLWTQSPENLGFGRFRRAKIDDIPLWLKRKVFFFSFCFPGILHVLPCKIFALDESPSVDLPKYRLLRPTKIPKTTVSHKTTFFYIRNRPSLKVMAAPASVIESFI